MRSVIEERVRQEVSHQKALVGSRGKVCDVYTAVAARHRRQQTDQRLNLEAGQMVLWLY